MTIEDLLAKHAITDRIHDYARGVDRIDGALMRSVFHEDARIEYGAMFQGSRDDLVDFIEAAHRPAVAHTHHISNVRIALDLEGGVAGSECYVVMRMRYPAAGGGFSDIFSTGRYVDEWERRDGEWRVRLRHYLHALDDAWAVTSSGFGPGGTRDATDPSYGALVMRLSHPES